MTGELTPVGGYASHGQKQKPKAAEEFEMNAESQEVAVRQQEKGGSGPAYILQLSPEARQRLHEQRAAAEERSSS